ncbi:hypothetical protein BV898_05223 [Hypsibius exemplaris]|uniref:Uncharacterized protein n=1 Tax=Hypsibius exemplaris TaxID=2072580 RepID=A0A1W0X088_HYPEX|nr:hypothetical protein BV898_05223 [Hypsibius exemplaris]
MWTRSLVGRPNKNVSAIRPFAPVRTHVGGLMVEFFVQRMSIDNELIRAVRPLTHPTGQYITEQLRTPHSIIGPDLSLRNFISEYKDFSRFGMEEGRSIRQNLLAVLQQQSLKLIAVCLARVVVAIPHSCDVERLISAYNVLNTPDRSQMTSETANQYLHVMINMPVLTKYNVWPAVQN